MQNDIHTLRHIVYTYTRRRTHSHRHTHTERWGTRTHIARAPARINNTVYLRCFLYIYKSSRTCINTNDFDCLLALERPFSDFEFSNSMRKLDNVSQNSTMHEIFTPNRDILEIYSHVYSRKAMRHRMFSVHCMYIKDNELMSSEDRVRLGWRYYNVCSIQIDVNNSSFDINNFIKFHYKCCNEFLCKWVVILYKWFVYNFRSEVWRTDLKKWDTKI